MWSKTIAISEANTVYYVAKTRSKHCLCARLLRWLNDSINIHPGPGAQGNNIVKPGGLRVLHPDSLGMPYQNNLHPINPHDSISHSLFLMDFSPIGYGRGLSLLQTSWVPSVRTCFVSLVSHKRLMNDTQSRRGLFRDRTILSLTITFFPTCWMVWYSWSGRAMQVPLRNLLWFCCGVSWPIPDVTLRITNVLKKCGE